MLHLAKRQLERGLRRANAEVGRPLLPAQDASDKPTSLYQSLPEDYVRLLTIQSADNDTVTCRLETYSLRLAPRYDAVSYSWGDDKTPARIRVNGFELQIRKSLLAFLKASLDRRPPLRPVWIDAVCLNQDDNVEKAVHIPLMGEVYKNASRTIVWLGEPEEDTFRTLVFMKSVVKFAKKYDDITAIGKDQLYPQEWERVRRYLQRPWFQRLWVLQEVLLSENIEILCHAQEIKFIPWKELVNFERTLLKRDGYGNLIDDNGETFDSGIHRSIHYMEVVRRIQRRSGCLKMSSLREYHYSRSCHEPVDRVWGVLGLLSPKLVAKVHEAKIIDYSEAGRREYWTSYLAFMKVLYAFDVVDFFDVITDDISRKKKPSSLPSWCVDFNAPKVYSSFRPFRSFRAGFLGSQDRTAIGSPLQLKDDTLSMSGFYVDDVSRVIAAHQRPEFPDDQAPPDDRPTPEDTEQIGIYVNWLLECYALCCETLGESRATRAAMCETMLAVDQEPRTIDFAVTAAKKEKVTVDSILIEAHFSQIKVFKALLRGEKNQEILQHDDYMPALSAACHNRRVFATKHGRIGLGPPDLKVGDMICSFIGAETLFALRTADRGFYVNVERRSRLVAPPPPVQETFRLIGDAYVHDLMFGEAFTAKDRGAKRTFTLV